MRGLKPSALCLAALSLLPAWAPLRAQQPDAAGAAEPATMLPPPPKLEVPGLKGDSVPLTLREVVLTTLAQNLDVKIRLSSRDIAAERAWGEMGIYDPVLGASITHTRTDRPLARAEGTDAYKGAIDQSATTAEMSLAQLTPLGSTVTVSVAETKLDDHKRSQQGPATALFDPSYTAIASLQVRQPLLKNFGPLVTNAAIRISARELEQSNEDFRGEVIERLADVMTAYWNLDFALRNLDVQRQAVESARELERVNAKRVEVGDLPMLSLLQAQAQVAEREFLMVDAESRVIDAQDALLQLMNWSRSAAQWNRPIYPSDQLTYYPSLDVDDEKAIQIGMERRPDIGRDRLALQIAEINRDVARRQRLPQLDAFAGYTLSGLDDDRGSAYGDITAGYFGGYNAGIEFRFPLINRRARADYHAALEGVERADLTIQNRELQVTREVRAASRAIRTSLKQIQATTRQVAADTEKLSAERKRLTVGERTIFDVLDFEDDLALSRANQARALADYQIALIDLTRATGVLLDVQNIAVAAQEQPKGWSTSFSPSDAAPAAAPRADEWVDFLRTLKMAAPAPP